MRGPTILSIASLIAVAACASPGPQVPRRPLSARAHLVEADRHEHEASALDQRADEIERAAQPTSPVCGDQALADQATSGGQRLGAQAPCWSDDRGAIARRREAAARLRADARAHRARARALVVTATTSCAGFDEDEIEHSPFEHRGDLAAVTAEVAGDRIVGARIRFARVPGLDADWLRRALACHQAFAAALGYEPLYVPTCPVVVEGARITVAEDPAGLTVVIVADDPAAALVIYARAEALLEEPAAAPPPAPPP